MAGAAVLLKELLALCDELRIRAASAASGLLAGAPTGRGGGGTGRAARRRRCRLAATPGGLALVVVDHERRNAEAEHDEHGAEHQPRARKGAKQDAAHEEGDADQQ